MGNADAARNCLFKAAVKRLRSLAALMEGLAEGLMEERSKAADWEGWKEAVLELIYPSPPRCALCRREGAKEALEAAAAFASWQQFGAGKAAGGAKAAWESWQRADGMPGVNGLAFCGACWEELAAAAEIAWKEPFCTACGHFTGVRQEEGAASSGCLNCGGKGGGFAFAGALAAAPFEGVWREAVHALKYRGQKAIAAFLGQFLAARLLAEKEFKRWLYAAPAAVIPVPLHPARQQERGFNQAELIGRTVARELGLDFWPQGLKRLRDTPSQTGLSLAERQSNLEGAFAAALPARRLRGRGILLVDDVLTTGSTCHECARVLAEEGSGPVWAAAAAAGRVRTASFCSEEHLA